MPDGCDLENTKYIQLLKVGLTSIILFSYTLVNEISKLGIDIIIPRLSLTVWTLNYTVIVQIKSIFKDDAKFKTSNDI